jgi:hypothetical protein
MKKMEIVYGIQERDDYPYGRLKCNIKFWVEFVKGKGFRWVSQTTNPKNGRLNAPKKSTYSQFMVHQIDENGHNKPFGLMLYGYEDISKLIEFLKVNEVNFTEEESQDIWTTVIACIRNNAAYTWKKEGVTLDQFLTTTKVQKMIEMYGNHEPINKITEIGYDLESINALKN